MTRLNHLKSSAILPHNDRFYEWEINLLWKITIFNFSLIHASIFPTNNNLEIRSLVPDFMLTPCSNNHHYQTMAAPYEVSSGQHK